MSARSRKVSFLGEAAAGLMLSLVAAAAATTLEFVMPAGIAARLIVAALGFAMVVRVMASAEDKTGRIVVVAAWFGIVAGAWFAGLSLPAYVAVQVAAVWLARSLFVHVRIIDAGLDLGLSLLAVSFAVFALVRTDSLWLGVWCFLLVQALHVGIPACARRFAGPNRTAHSVCDPHDRFGEAVKAADEALRRIAGRA